MYNYHTIGTPLIPTTDLPFTNEYGRFDITQRPPIIGTSGAVGPTTHILTTSPATLDFITAPGVTPTPQALRILDIGTGSDLPFTIVSMSTKLSVAPALGITPATIAVSCNVTGLPIGVYTSELHVNASTATPAVIIVPVTLTIGSGGVLTTCSTTKIEGWAQDPLAPSSIIQVGIFDGPGVLGTYTNLIAQLTADDTIGALPAGHAFTLPTPASLLGVPHTIHAYAYYNNVLHELTGSPQTITPITPVGSLLTASGRFFQYNNTTFQWKGVTWFMGVWELLQGRGAAMATKLAALKNLGVNVVRVLGMVGWDGYVFGPATAGYYAACKTFIQMAATQDIIVEFVLLADVASVPTMNTQANRVLHAKTFAQTCSQEPNFCVEMVNENEATSQLSLADIVECANQITTYDKGRLIALSCEFTRTDSRYMLPPSTYNTLHPPRSIDWDWITVLFDDPFAVINQSGTIRPPVSDEPINATRPEKPGAYEDPNEARWYAYGVGCQIRQIGSTFHSGQLKYCKYPGEDTGYDPLLPTMYARWKAGVDDAAVLVTDPAWVAATYFRNTAANSSIVSWLGTETLVVGRMIPRTASAAGRAKVMVVLPSSIDYIGAITLKDGWSTVSLIRYIDADGMRTYFLDFTQPLPSTTPIPA